MKNNSLFKLFLDAAFPEKEASLLHQKVERAMQLILLKKTTIKILVDWK